MYFYPATKPKATQNIICLKEDFSKTFKVNLSPFCYRRQAPSRFTGFISKVLKNYTTKLEAILQILIFCFIFLYLSILKLETSWGRIEATRKNRQLSSTVLYQKGRA